MSTHDGKVAGGHAKKVHETAATTVNLDTLSTAEIAQRKADALAAIATLRASWPGLELLEKSERKTSPGKLLAVLAKPLGTLFGILAPVTPPTDANDVKNLGALKAQFNALAAEDQGYDPETFEVDLLQRRTARAEAEAEIGAALTEAARAFADDALATGAEVVGPGLKAFDIARSLARNNALFKTMLAPLTNALGEMTSRARTAQKKPAPATAAGSSPATATDPKTT